MLPFFFFLPFFIHYNLHEICIDRKFLFFLWAYRHSTIKVWEFGHMSLYRKKLYKTTHIVWQIDNTHLGVLFSGVEEEETGTYCHTIGFVLIVKKTWRCVLLYNRGRVVKLLSMRTHVSKLSNLDGQNANNSFLCLPASFEVKIRQSCCVSD